eukprot:1679439-Rhodomonas_salina.1
MMPTAWKFPIFFHVIEPHKHSMQNNLHPPSLIEESTECAQTHGGTQFHPYSFVTWCPASRRSAAVVKDTMGAVCCRSVKNTMGAVCCRSVGKVGVPEPSKAPHEHRSNSVVYVANLKDPEEDQTAEDPEKETLVKDPEEDSLAKDPDEDARWKEIAAEQERRSDLCRKVVRRMLQSHLAAAFDRFAEAVAEKQDQREVLRRVVFRMMRLKLAVAWERFVAGVEEEREYKARVGQALGRWMQPMLLETLIAWKEL